MANYQDYQPKETTREREGIEWSISYTFNATDKKNPRVLLIGDSICNAYQVPVRKNLENACNVSFWASSKCVTDPDYFRELDFVLGAYEYDVITFNNGLHSLTTNREEWIKAYRAAVTFIQDKLKAKLFLVLSTPLTVPEWTAQSAEPIYAGSGQGKRLAGDRSVYTHGCVGQSAKLERYPSFPGRCRCNAGSDYFGLCAQGFGRSGNQCGSRSHRYRPQRRDRINPHKKTHLITRCVFLFILSAKQRPDLSWLRCGRG